ncbi:MAG: Heavy metal transport/detoxification protein [Ferruginibacter sp.]|nr:Heavy metal transport/detoxification protein [Ferruginibacter sp.]
MKSLLVAFALFISVTSNAQVTRVNLQASGLTCSMCSNAINTALKTLDYVDKVYANIKTSSFDLSFKPGARVDFDEIKKKVEDAGFSIAKMQATVQFNNQAIQKDAHVSTNGMLLHFVNASNKTLNGTQTLQIVDKGYVSAKAFKKNQLTTTMDCYKTGVAGSCCTKTGVSAGARVYHVTI